MALISRNYQYRGFDFAKLLITWLRFRKSTSNVASISRNYYCSNEARFFLLRVIVFVYKIFCNWLPLLLTWFLQFPYFRMAPKGLSDSAVSITWWSLTQRCQNIINLKFIFKTFEDIFLYASMSSSSAKMKPQLQKGPNELKSERKQG